MHHNILITLAGFALCTQSYAGSIASVNTYGGSLSCSGCIATSSFDGTYKSRETPPWWWGETEEVWELEGTLRQHAMATVDGGTLRAQAQSSFTPTRIVGDSTYMNNSYAGASASISDVLLIDTPTSHGSRGRFTITLQAHWAFPEFQGYYSIGASSGIRITDSTGLSAEASLQTSGYYLDWPELQSDAYYREGNSWSYSEFSPTLRVSLPITYGTPLNLHFFLGVGIGGNYTYEYSGSVQAANSSTWGGISNLIDSMGNPVTDYTTSSESGFDWERSYISQVPESPTKFLMLIGTLLLIRQIRLPVRHTKIRGGI